MREIVTAVEMKELDHNTIQKAGISSPVLMERAALKTVEEIVQRLKNKEKEKILTAALRGGLVERKNPCDLRNRQQWRRRIGDCQTASVERSQNLVLYCG